MEYIFKDRALILQDEDKSLLIATDIHIGYEASVLERTGAEFPSQKEPMVNRLSALIERYDVGQVYLIGDIKHSIGIDRAYNWREIPDFMERVSELAKVTVIPGNHDGEVLAVLPRNVNLGNVHGEVTSFNEQKVGILHGHAWPTAEVLASDTIIMGHNHPTVRRLKDASSPQIGRPERKRYAMVIPVILRSKLDRDCVRRAQGQLELEDGVCNLIVLPSFNDLLSGAYVNRPGAKLQGPFFENGCASLMDVEVYSIEGVFLGSIGLMQKQFVKSSTTK
jgi:putative SbcD/Mre11-related phosphoesterase